MIDRCCSIAEGNVVHRCGGNEVNVAMRNFETSNDESNSFAGKYLFLYFGNAMSGGE